MYKSYDLNGNFMGFVF